MALTWRRARCRSLQKMGMQSWFVRQGLAIQQALAIPWRMAAAGTSAIRSASRPLFTLILLHFTIIVSPFGIVSSGITFLDLPSRLLVRPLRPTIASCACGLAGAGGGCRPATEPKPLMNAAFAIRSDIHGRLPQSHRGRGARA